LYVVEFCTHQQIMIIYEITHTYQKTHFQQTVPTNYFSRRLQHTTVISVTALFDILICQHLKITTTSTSHYHSMAQAS